MYFSKVAFAALGVALAGTNFTAAAQYWETSDLQARALEDDYYGSLAARYADEDESVPFLGPRDLYDDRDFLSRRNVDYAALLRRDLDQVAILRRDLDDAIHSLLRRQGSSKSKPEKGGTRRPQPAYHRKPVAGEDGDHLVEEHPSPYEYANAVGTSRKPVPISKDAKYRKTN